MPNIMALGLVDTDMKIFSCFSLFKPLINVTPGAGPVLALVEQTWKRSTR